MGFGGVDVRTRRGGGKSGFVVGRLKTAKGDVKYGSVTERFSKDSGNIQGVRHEEDGNEMGARASGRPGIFNSLRARSYKHDSTREETEGCTHRFSRDYGRKGEAAQDSKRTWRGEGRGRDTDVTSHNLRSKTRKPSERNENDDAVENSDRKDFKQKHNIVQVSQSSKRNSQHEELLNKHVKKTIHKKSSCEDSPTADDRPKKKKRVIRLDPNDTSNKRIDDSAAPTEETVEEKEDTELSKNAQLRAIKPSPSIHSFMEDNLLGRRRTIELKKAGYNIDLSAPLDNIPLSTSTERERIEESVFRNKLEFFAAAKVSTSFPPPVLPEIAIAGRSNVGKSSLLNALTRQWGVVRTSDKPGHTQTINFFRLASKLCMVDLPGYGFAYAKEEVKDAWEELVKEYVSTRDGLQRVCLLVDTKWGMKPRDHELIELMERSKTPYQIVLTKTDIVFPMDVARRAMQIQEDLKTMKSKVDPVMMVSSKSGAGIRSLRMVLSKLARFIKP